MVFLLELIFLTKLSLVKCIFCIEFYLKFVFKYLYIYNL